MDNLSAPIPSTSPQPAIVSPAESPNRRWPLWLIGGISLLGFGIAIGVFGAKFLNQSQSQTQLTLIPTPALSLTPTSIPTIDLTANWRVHINDSYNLQFLYPPAYTIEGDQTGGGFQIIINKGKDSEIVIGISPRNIGQLDTFLETSSKGKITIGENTWREFFLPQGYQDAGDTNIKPVYALKIAKGSFIYTARIFGFSLTKEQSQILSTFKFTDTETVEAPVRNIVYKKTPGWSDFKSNAGYSLQTPPTFSDTDGSGEESRDGVCFMFFGNNAGGIISAKVIPYSGGSRRELYGIQPGYDYSFEEASIQNKKSLIIEAGPIGDSGSGSGVVIPVGDHALIISWSNRAKSSAEFNSLLQSITLQSSLDISQCEK